MEHVQNNTGLRAIAITDHNTLEGSRFARAMAEEYAYDFEVIPGEEVTCRTGHVIGLFIEEEVRPGMSARDTIRAIEEQGGIAIIPHPFSKQGVFGPFGRSGIAEAINDLAFHALEVYNSLPYLHWANKTAAKVLAAGHGIAATGGSDAHVLEAVGKGYTIYRGTTANDLKRSILDLETRAAADRQGLSIAWRLARRYPEIRRMQEWNWERCKAG